MFTNVLTNGKMSQKHYEILLTCDYDLIAVNTQDRCINACFYVIGFAMNRTKI